MQNHSTVLDQTTWGIHLNFEGHFDSPLNHPSWLTQLQQQEVVVWEAGIHIVAHLYADYALKLLEHLHGDDVWKTEGCVIGSPAFQLSTNSVSTPSTLLEEEWVLKNQIRLGADQTQAVVEFLTTWENLLKRISIHDKEDAEESIKKVYQLIAAYGRKVRERKGDSELIENMEPKVIPTSIPRGSYFTVYQAAQVCDATSKQIRAWIRKGNLEALNLPGLGIIIEAGKLHDFLHQIRSIQNSPTPERSHKP